MPGPGELSSQQPARIIGRAAGLARLRGLVDPVPQASQVLLVIGEAGMGKTVLLADAADRARAAGMRVLPVTGRESESKLAFAGLHQLLRPVLSGAAGLPGRQAQALSGALGLAADPVAPDPLLTGVAVLTLLSDLSERVPVLVVADDAHWLDHSTLGALAFAGSRLDAERVVLLVGARGLAPPPGFDRGFPELHLEPLSAADAGCLLDGQPRPPRGRARAQVLAQAAGNPMALIELAKVIAADPAASRRWAAEPLPLTDRLTAVLTSRFAALPGPVQAALLLAAVADGPDLRLAARHAAGWALAWSGQRTAALTALISVADEASRDQPDLAWDALGNAATVAYQSGALASRQAVSRTLGLLERQGTPPPGPGPGPGIDVNGHELWMRASTDPIGSRSQLLPYLRTIAGSPLDEPSLWGTGSAAWILDETDLAIRLLQDAMHRLQAPGVRGTSGGALTVLGWAYIDTGRWDEALDVAAEAAGLAEANHMDLVAASADVITATVLALRAESGAARRHAARALATVDPAECGLVAARARRALGVAALADGRYLSAFTQLRGLFSDDGTPLHNYASYLGVADLAAAAIRADRRIEGRDVIERALSRLDGRASARLEQLIARARPARRAGRGGNLFRQRARRPRRGAVAIRAGAASPGVRRMAAAQPPDQRRQARPDRSPGNLPATRCPVMGAAGAGRAESLRGDGRRGVQ
jgi:tetratricopeptide (TPR) repeat protein